MTRRAPFLLGFAAALLAPALASATPNFPPEITNHLQLTYEPPCALCHLNGVTGTGTVTTPFGVSMRGAGLQPNDTGTLDAALDTLAANNTDSDQDGTPDITELMQGTDPNTAGASTTSLLTPKYGCGGSDLTWPKNPSVAVGVLGMIGLVVLAARKRRPS